MARARVARARAYCLCRRHVAAVTTPPPRPRADTVAACLHRCRRRASTVPPPHLPTPAQVQDHNKDPNLWINISSAKENGRQLGAADKEARARSPISLLAALSFVCSCSTVYSGVSCSTRANLKPVDVKNARDRTFTRAAATGARANFISEVIEGAGVTGRGAPYPVTSKNRRHPVQRASRTRLLIPREDHTPVEVCDEYFAEVRGERRV